MNNDKIVGQVEAMLAAGRITEDEAADIRAARGPDELDRAVGMIGARHAGGHIESAVASGEMTRQEGDAYLDELRAGRNPKGLRARLSTYRRRRATS